MNTEEGYETGLDIGEDYIGYTGHLKLDTRNLTYIGSDFIYNGVELLTDPDEIANYNDIYKASGENYSKYLGIASKAGVRGQRWHFTQGLTSSTSVSYPVSTDKQALIADATRQLQEDHPHAVIVEFNDFIAYGNPWNIRLLGSLYNEDQIRFFSTNADERPEWVTSSTHTSTTYQNAKIYKRDGTLMPYTIDKELTPMVVYEAYKTAADDRAVSGTH